MLQKMSRHLLLLTLCLLPFLTGCSDYGLTYIPPDVVEEVQGTIVSDTFEIKEQKLDVLFVVDYSCSMSAEHSALLNYLPDMYQDLTSGLYDDMDWRVGLIETDPNGELLGQVEFDEQNPEFGLWTMLLQTPIIYTGKEAGLDAVVSSLGRDTNFHRIDADLLVLYVSDEADQSDISIENYQYLMGIAKPGPYRVSEAALVYPPGDETAGCLDNTNDIGTGYLEVAEIVRSFCDPNTWESIFEEAHSALRISPEWELSETPINPDQIEVFLDNTPLEDWTYDESTNTVIPTIDLMPGTQVLIVYTSLLS